MATSSFDAEFVIVDPEEVEKFLEKLNDPDIVYIPSSINSEENFFSWLQEDPSMEYIVDTLESLVEIVELAGMHDYPEYHRAKSLVKVLEKKLWVN